MPLKRLLLHGPLQECEAVRHLRRLDKRGEIQLDSVRLHGADAIATEIARSDAIICRPTQDGRISEQMLSQVNRRLCIATLSKGTDHIAVPTAVSHLIEVISARGDVNAAGVAELTTMLADLLLRPVHQAIDHVSGKMWVPHRFAHARRLAGVSWACVGAGDQVRKLIPLLISRHVTQIRVFHDRMDVDCLDRCLLDLPTGVRLSPVAAHSPPTTKVDAGAGHTVDIIGYSDIQSAVAGADVVSLHVPLNNDDPKTGRKGTRGIIDAPTIAKMGEGALVVNVARGGVVIEQACLDALEDGKLGGFASDVVDELAESTGDPRYSVLWQRLIRQRNRPSDGQEKELNLILTPHIGGSTADSIDNVTWSVINELLQRLGIRPPTEH